MCVGVHQAGEHCEPAQVDVDWPDGQDWPSTVAIDQIETHPVDVLVVGAGGAGLRCR